MLGYPSGTFTWARTPWVGYFAAWACGYTQGKVIKSAQRMHTKSVAKVNLWLVAICFSASVLILNTGCSSKPNEERLTSASPTSVTGVPSAAILAPGTRFLADPDPVPVSSRVTRLSWTTNVAVVEVHIGAPDGPLFARDGGISSASTGPWVVDNMTFYLQDGTGKNPTDKSATLATLAVPVK
jgi:hypothetical protein